MTSSCTILIVATAKIAAAVRAAGDGHALGQFDVRQMHRLVESQVRQVHREELRQVLRQAGDVHFRHQVGDDAAILLHTRGPVSAPVKVTTKTDDLGSVKEVSPAGTHLRLFT